MRVNQPMVKRAGLRYDYITGLIPNYPVNKMG